MDHKIQQLTSALRLARQRVKTLEGDIQRTVADSLLSTGLSCREIARMMEYSAPYISDIQNCRRHISDEFLERMKNIKI